MLPFAGAGRRAARAPVHSRKRQPSPRGARHHGDLRVLRREPAELWATLSLSELFFSPGNEDINSVMVAGGWSCEGDVHKALCMVPRSSRVSNLLHLLPLSSLGLLAASVKWESFIPTSQGCSEGEMRLGLRTCLAHTGELCLPQGLRKVIP